MERTSIGIVQIARQILGMIFQNRRLLSGYQACQDDPCSQCYQSQLDKITYFLERHEAIHCVLPAFPAKSSNLENVSGPLPDRGEELALQSLYELCEKVRRIFPPGMRITICSDGRVFNDLVEVSDENVSAYSRKIHELIQTAGYDSSVDTFDMEDVYDVSDYDQMRTELSRNYATPLEELRRLVKQDEMVRSLFNGIHRFIFEDMVVLHKDYTRNKLRNLSKEKAYRVVQRSNAWSSLVREHFPHALRFSIHPQSPHGEKIGITMVKCKNIWGTPWHNIALYDGQEFTLEKRKTAENMGAQAIVQPGQSLFYSLVPETCQNLKSTPAGQKGSFN